jgi:hypothetical protein
MWFDRVCVYVPLPAGAMVESACPGVVTQRTPRGMMEVEWRNGLRKYAATKAKSAS